MQHFIDFSFQANGNLKSHFVGILMRIKNKIHSWLLHIINISKVIPFNTHLFYILYDDKFDDAKNIIELRHRILLDSSFSARSLFAYCFSSDFFSFSIFIHFKDLQIRWISKNTLFLFSFFRFIVYIILSEIELGSNKNYGMKSISLNVNCFLP